MLAFFPGGDLKRLACCMIWAAAILPAQDDLSVRYRDASRRIIDAALQSDAGLDRLAYLCDRIGHRVSGSKALDNAIAWSAAEMKRAGLQNVRAIPVMVPHWVRGEESAAMLLPLERPLAMLGLGDSVGTPPDGVSADVVRVGSFDEMAQLGRAGVAGKIVLFDVPYAGYGQTVPYRTNGPARAAELGAAAVLVRSITPHSLRSPHTGVTVYPAGSPRIPGAAVAVEDAEMITRLIQAGNRVRVRLKMQAHREADSPSADVIGELPGAEKPDEVIVMGGHIDSWDVGQGAQDDGSGIMAALEAASVLQKLGLRPRRTIRVVFWTNEENGGAGGRGYRDWLGDKVKQHVAAIEMDGGAEKLVGFGLSMGGSGQRIPDAVMAAAAGIGKLLEPLDGSSMTAGFGGSDIEPLMAAGVPGFGLRTTGAHYFDWHHTQADTFDKIDPAEFRKNAAALAVLSYVLADMPVKLEELK
ncbi:MAG TPA: peptidase M28 family protein [Solibacterales bacterium]|nr:peptidase M28 family protein [Bryobacterales bacterium]